MKFYLGLLLGLAAGVAIGLLVAPQSGEATRAQLSEQGIMLGGGTFSDDIRARANEALAQGRDLYSRTRGELTTQYNRAKSGEL
jgi:gas vesicle protein